MQIFSQDVSKTLFITKKSHITHLDEPVNVILSPQYYWVKKAELPVSRLYEAKKYAPAIFEEHLPKQQHFRYIVTALSDKNRFIILAYDAEEIFGMLEKQIGDFSKVKKVFFSQFELADMPQCLTVTKETSLHRADDLILYAPTPCANEEDVEHYIENLKLSRHFITPVSLTQELVSSRVAYSVIAALTLLSVGFGLEYLYHLREKRHIAQEMEKIAQRYHLPATSMQRESILRSLQKKEQAQKRVRELLHTVSLTPLDGKGRVKRIYLQKGRLHLETESTDPALQEKIVRYLGRHAKIEKVSYENGRYKVVIR